MFWYFSWALELVVHQSWCSESLSILVTSTVTSSWLGFNSAPVGLLHASTMAGELSVPGVPHLGPWPKCWWRFEGTVWGGTFFGFVVPLHDQNLILQYFTIHLCPDYQSRSPSRLQLYSAWLRQGGWASTPRTSKCWIRSRSWRCHVSWDFFG